MARSRDFSDDREDNEPDLGRIALEAIARKRASKLRLKGKKREAYIRKSIAAQDGQRTRKVMNLRTKLWLIDDVGRPIHGKDPVGWYILNSHVAVKSKAWNTFFAYCQKLGYTSRQIRNMWFSPKATRGLAA